MNRFLIFASVLGVAYAGVGQLGPGEESSILDLYEKLCNGGGGGYGGGYGGGAEAQNIGGALVYCKQANNGRRESLRHHVNVPGSSGQDQVVFVRPPPVHYDHKIVVQGGQAQGQKTKIYVLPSKSSHNVQTEVNPGSTVPQKPTVYFLSSSSSNPGYGAPPPPPSNSYGAPEIRAPQSSYGAPEGRLHKRSHINYPVQVEYKNL